MVDGISKPYQYFSMTTDNVDVRDLLNAQTGKLEWPELQRHFARGLVLKVADDLDLVEVAALVVKDDRDTIETWAAGGQVAKVTDEDAKAWEADRPLFWAVVVAPWVLVQEITT